MQMTLCYWLWNGSEHGKNYNNENLMATIPYKDNGKYKTTEECGIFQLFGQNDNK